MESPASKNSSAQAARAQEILTRLAAAASSEIARLVPDLKSGELKATFTYAAELVRQQNQQSPSGASLVTTLTGEQETVELDAQRILIVDDIQENLLIMQHMFKESAYTVSVASNAEEALEKARTELPILIISDVQMPRVSGLDLLQALKSDQRTKNIAVILVTAHHRTPTNVSQGLQMGADDYIYRPFVRDEFMSRVEAVMRVKWAEAEAQQQARIITRRNKGLELVNDLALAVNSTLELKEIFASALQKLSQLLNARLVSLVLLNEEKQALTADIASHTGKRISVSLESFTEKTLLPDELFQELPALMVQLLNNYQLDLELDTIPAPRTVQLFPMRTKERTIGAIAVVNEHQDSLDKADWVLLNSAAGIIAVAVENSRLLENRQQLVDDLTTLNEIARTLTSTLDLNQILKLTTVLVQRSVEAEAASFWFIEEDGRELTLTASSGLGAEKVIGYRMSIDQGIVGHTIKTGVPYISADVRHDKHYFPLVAQQSNYSPRSIASVPVKVKGEIIGVMQALHHKAGWFDRNDLRLFDPIASSVAIAVENARLFSEVQNFNRHLEQMVTDRTRELAEEKEKVEAILASMADGLLVLDAENRVLTANKAAEELLDFELQDLLGHKLDLHNSINPVWRCISEMGSNSDLKVNTLVDVPTPEPDETLSVQAHSAKLRSEDNQIIGTVIVVRDITTLTEVERMKARFMASVTHELKTPLSVIQLHTGNLLSYYERLPEAKKLQMLDSINNQSGLLRQLIEDILQLSRLDAGVTETERQALDLRAILTQTVADLRPLAEAKQISLEWQQPAGPVMTLGDPELIGRLARNLIDNAVKYTPAGGTVKVETEFKLVRNQLLALIQVTDTGIGIPLEHQAQIFNRFHRVDPYYTTPGTGLGLSIVKEIVNAHQGNIQLESKPGVGTTFVVSLPGLAEQ